MSRLITPSSLAATALVAAQLLRSGTSRAEGGKLLVYLHVAAKQRALQGLLNAGLPGVATTAVGRIADFTRALGDGPDAVLTLLPVLSAQGMSPHLRGYRGGAADEKYALVGAGRAPEPANVGAIGALDLLGREGTSGFVRSLLGRTVRVERVTKVEDLLPLVQMERVDAVLLPSRLFSDMRANSRLPLAQTELDTRVGLPAAVSLSQTGASVLAAVSKLPRDVCQLFGVEEWR